MKTRTVVLMALFLTFAPAIPLHAETLPGFRVVKIADVSGYLTGIAFDSSDRLYYASRTGSVYRVEGGKSVQVATVPTANVGNAALLGLAFRSSHEFVAHYVIPDLTADIIVGVDLESGEQKEIARFLCDEGRPCSSEHHGGNPIVAPDGSIFFGIGDFGGGLVAQNPLSPGGKIFRISPSGDVTQFAMGLRNPFDMAWDPVQNRLLVSDNGPVGGDEINVVNFGDNLGWPYTVGMQPPIDGAVPPVYTFPTTTAPTGVFFVQGPAPMPRGGLLVGSYVPKTLYYFPDMSARPMPDPIALVRDEGGEIIDVAQNRKNEIFYGTGSGIYKLSLPLIGDADGDYSVRQSDLDAVAHEILDGDGKRAVDTQGGDYRGSWGADVNLDGLVDTRDLVMLSLRLTGRTRPVR